MRVLISALLTSRPLLSPRCAVGMNAPVLPVLPASLAASDSGFTYDSVHRRLPLIAEAIISNNPSYSAELQSSLRALAAEVAADAPLLALSPSNALDAPTWDAALAPHLSASSGWLSTPWFLIENYFYKRVLALTDAETGGADPFAKQKADSLDASQSAFASMLEAITEKNEKKGNELETLISMSLWGNLADLSLSAGAGLTSSDLAAGVSSTMMLADETAKLCAAIRSIENREMIIILDNCGLELLADLILVDGLLRMCSMSRVVLHAKDRPVFVSDVTLDPKTDDLQLTLEWMRAHGGAAVAARLEEAITDGRLVIEAPSFYTSPNPFWEMPTELERRLGSAALVLLKGDANYRRLLGDRHWPHQLKFEALVKYFPTQLAALRTCKSGVLVGVSKEREAAAVRALPESWLTGGKYGLVQAKLEVPTQTRKAAYVDSRWYE